MDAQRGYIPRGSRREKSLPVASVAATWAQLNQKDTVCVSPTYLKYWSQRAGLSNRRFWFFGALSGMPAGFQYPLPVLLRFRGRGSGLFRVGGDLGERGFGDV